jgi:hypothetical protein
MNMGPGAADDVAGHDEGGGGEQTNLGRGWGCANVKEDAATHQS